MMKSQFEAEKQLKNSYYEEIHHQYLSELEKKDKSKFGRDKKDEPVLGLPLFNPNMAEQKLNYKK